MWFHRCPEDIPLAKKRYIEQIARVFEVLDNILTDKEYLVDNKLLVSLLLVHDFVSNSEYSTYADLAFVPWNRVAAKVPFFKEPLWERYQVEKKYPHYVAWQNRLSELPSVKRAYKE